MVGIGDLAFSRPPWQDAAVAIVPGQQGGLGIIVQHKTDMPNPPGDSNALRRGTTFGAPRAVGGLLPAIVRPAFRKRAPATAQLLADWPAITGPAIAAVSLPRKLFQGTLAIACSGAIAMELQHMAPQLIQRINGHFGQNMVTRLRFVQDASVAPVLPAAPPKLATEAARAAVRHLPEGRLRDALIGLGGHLMGKS